MPDDIATESSDHAEWQRVQKLLRHAMVQRGLLALLIVTGALFTLWAVLRLQQVADLETRIATMESEVVSLRQKLETQDLGLQVRLDALERVLFGEVVSKLKPPPSMTVPGWLERRNKELQERILTLERWRMRVDKDLRDDR